MVISLWTFTIWSWISGIAGVASAYGEHAHLDEGEK